MKAAIKRTNVSSGTNFKEDRPQPAVRFQPVLEQGRRLVLVYLGLWGLLSDQTNGLYRSGEQLLNDAIERGERMEEALYETLARWSRRLPQCWASLHRRGEEDLRRIAQQVQEAGEDFDEQLERQVARALAKLGIPTRERLAKLNREIERLNAILDEKLAQKEAVHA